AYHGNTAFQTSVSHSFLSPFVRLREKTVAGSFALSYSLQGSRSNGRVVSILATHNKHRRRSRGGWNTGPGLEMRRLAAVCVCVGVGGGVCVCVGVLG